MQHDSSSDPGNPYATPSYLGAADNIAPSGVLDGPLRPFQTIWLHPRLTISRIVAEDPTLHVLPLVCLSGIVQTLDRASMRNAGDQMSLVSILILACVVGPLGGLLSLWIFSHLIRLTGGWIGGTAIREDIKAAIAWSSLPAVCTLPLWIPQLALFGSELFTTETPRLDAEPMLWFPFIGIAIVEGVLGIWGFVLLCNTVAEVQGFRSAWSGFGNVILAGLTVVIPLIVVVLLLVGLVAR